MDKEDKRKYTDLLYKVVNILLFYIIKIHPPLLGKGHRKDYLTFIKNVK